MPAADVAVYSLDIFSRYSCVDSLSSANVEMASPIALTSAVRPFPIKVATAPPRTEKPSPESLADSPRFFVPSPASSAASPRSSAASLSSPISSLASPEFCAACSAASPRSSVASAAVSSWESYRFSSISVAAISRCNAANCSCEIFPSPSCFSACTAASFSVPSFSSVLLIACVSNSCFWASISVLVGSSFSSFSTSFSCACVEVMDLFTSCRDSESCVVSPPISMVNPLIRLSFATALHLPQNVSKSRCVARIG